MTTLNLGVVEQNYRTEGTGTVRGKGRTRRKAHIGSRTTFDVAQILEAKYGIMRAFYDHHADEIGDEIANAYAGALETLLIRGVRGEGEISLAGTALSKTKTAFDKFITEGEVEQIGIAGVPTMAALHGVSHRFAHPYAKRGRRASFYDTGLYLASFIAWID